MRKGVGILAAVLVVAMALGSAVRVEDVWAKGGGGSGGSGGGGCSGGGGGTGGGGTAGGGGTGGGAGSLTGVTGAGRAPADPRLYARSTARLSDADGTVPRDLRAMLTLTVAQRGTWDAFRRCAPSGTILDQLRVDGSFTFRTESVHDAQTVRQCMSRVGYRFDY